MRALVSDTVFDGYRHLLDAAAPDVRWIRMRPDGSLHDDAGDVSADDAKPDVAFLSNDVFYGPVKAFLDIVVSSPGLQWLQSAAAGVESPALRVHLERGGRLSRAHVTAVPIAEYVMASVLARFQRVDALADLRRERRWQHHAFTEVWRTTWVIVGVGAIGREVAERARAFGAHVVGVRRHPRGDEPVAEMIHPGELRDVLPRADVVVLAAELNDGNRHLVDAAFLEAMKPGSVLVNVARGGLVDEAALLDALQRGAPQWAVLDVFETEPLPADSPFWDHPQVVWSPHSSGGGNGRLTRAVEVFVENLPRHRQGQPLVHEVTLDDLPAQPGTWHVAG
jgi:phosphoglycerate dehydrogenase-like enzyme